ncbi:MAG: polyprenyl synthetase family protein [Deltaproteobacteria bacterium]|nr:polyprenyl synthetase family protein [Deltaproteobacteria bacterium]
MNDTFTMDLSDTLKSEIVWLNRYLEDLSKESEDILGGLLSYVLVNSGKRIRPMLVVLGSNLGESDINHVRLVGAAVEMIHIATLVHDDIIDKSILRRGQKTVASEHGIDKAVLLGDYLYSQAFEKIMATSNIEVLKIMAKTASVICRGEIEQLNKKFEFEVSEYEYYSFIKRKTASFFGAAARSGAVIANTDLRIQIALESYGINLGMGFQIKDDLLDITGDEDVVGKTLHTDMVNGRMTLPLIHFRDTLPSPQAFKKLMDEMAQSNDNFSKILERIREAGSIRYAEDVATQYVEKALDSLKMLPEGEAKDQLFILAKQSLKRKS